MRIDQWRENREASLLPEQWGLFSNCQNSLFWYYFFTNFGILVCQIQIVVCELFYEETKTLPSKQIAHWVSPFSVHWFHHLLHPWVFVLNFLCLVFSSLVKHRSQLAKPEWEERFQHFHFSPSSEKGAGRKRGREMGEEQGIRQL